VGAAWGRAKGIEGAIPGKTGHVLRASGYKWGHVALVGELGSRTEGTGGPLPSR